MVCVGEAVYQLGWAYWIGNSEVLESTENGIMPTFPDAICHSYDTNKQMKHWVFNQQYTNLENIFMDWF